MDDGSDDDLYRAIADPRRRAMLDAMRAGERTVGELVEIAGTSQPAVSQHLALLARAGLVAQRRSGRHRYYSVRAERLAVVAEWIAQYEAFWTGRIDALERYLARRKN